MKTNIGSSLFVFMILALQGGLAQSAGDGSVIPLPEEDRLAIEKYLGKGVVGEAIPAPALADTTRYLAINVSARNYRLVSGPDKGKVEHHQTTLLKQDGGGTTWRYDTGARFIFFINAKANGDYIVTGATDNEEGVMTQYLPGEPLMLQGLAPGKERNITVGMKVFDLSNPDEQTHTGSLNIDYRYMGAYKVTVPAGSFDAVLVKWTFKGKIGPASLNDTQYRFFVADVGMVAAVEQMDVSAMLIYNKQRKIARVLVDKPKS
ncbi:hypothetical protein [Nitrosomonas sp. Nm58]|jgi:hypothetical protein|uniref:hypothetical protein n=1 Tax=Nitrosomonas sp. Nm58 TaxID=200126 RepID=UPI00089AF258|nr:hypothetical protein [Nitrosomonas sp. Nm58]SDY02983.1 hypothetical protein SAMN05421754_1001108 [Nitrosomonas sp. Nm58]